MIGAYSLGKAQRVIAVIRKAGYDRPIYLHGAMETLTRYYESRGIALGELRAVRDAKKAELAGAIALCPPSALQEVWSRRFPDPVSAFASGWMRVRARARQRGVELPLVISDHADWDGLTATIAATGASDIWVTHGQEDALVHWSRSRGLNARPLDIVGYGDEDESDGVSDSVAPGEALSFPSPASGGGLGRGQEYSAPPPGSPDQVGGRRPPPQAGEVKRMARRHEALRRTARPPCLRARPQQQAAADDGLFPQHARSGARLGAGGAHRRAVIPICQAQCAAHADRAAHRSGAVRALA